MILIMKIIMTTKIFPPTPHKHTRVKLKQKAPVTPDIRPGYDIPATEKCWNRGQLVERTHDWSQRSWVIARAKLVVTSSMVMLKTSNLRFQNRKRSQIGLT